MINVDIIIIEFSQVGQNHPSLPMWQLLCQQKKKLNKMVQVMQGNPSLDWGSVE